MRFFPARIDEIDATHIGIDRIENETGFHLARFGHVHFLIEFEAFRGQQPVPPVAAAILQIRRQRIVPDPVIREIAQRHFGHRPFTGDFDAVEFRHIGEIAPDGIDDPFLSVNATSPQQQETCQQILFHDRAVLGSGTGTCRRITNIAKYAEKTALRHKKTLRRELFEIFTLEQQQVDDADGDVTVGEVEDRAEKQERLPSHPGNPRRENALHDREKQHIHDFAVQKSGITAAFGQESGDARKGRFGKQQPVERAVEHVAERSGKD